VRIGIVLVNFGPHLPTNTDTNRGGAPVLVDRCRRLAHDYERLAEHSEAMVKWSMIGLVARRLAPAAGRRPCEPAKAS
jgi:transposase